MKKREYRPINYFIKTYGVSKSFIENLISSEKLAYTRSSPGTRSIRLICINEWNAYFEQFRVEANFSSEAIAASL